MWSAVKEVEQKSREKSRDKNLKARKKSRKEKSSTNFHHTVLRTNRFVSTGGVLWKSSSLQHNFVAATSHRKSNQTKVCAPCCGYKILLQRQRFWQKLSSEHEAICRCHVMLQLAAVRMMWSVAAMCCCNLSQHQNSDATHMGARVRPKLKKPTRKETFSPCFCPKKLGGGGGANCLVNLVSEFLLFSLFRVTLVRC